MGKLPKSMQEKKRKAKALRTQGSAPSNKSNVSNKSMNRQMRRRMQQQGVDGMEPIEAYRVIIQTENEDLVIDDPQVIKVKQQGMEVFQVIGSPKKQPASSYKTGQIDNNLETSADSEEIQEEFDDDSNLNVEITEQDIQLVSMQTGVTPKEAERALKETNGDLARAIINLKTK
ncbi:nascent polypeptide-associated complex protein [Promethearchaeum syntrophicum]|uniref:Nascent polypeptide-associated complex protein n=1 Tax=Promethearchaeum syntrophicum TaxID=2594042 RepID=A0A5B9D7W5_9ARCH|nr:nascent polypeptide-associated complex protein [Candidatus Prometheoarchaeum syntrophicum]QEE14820.1 Nascent polypeptide-associated complex protein [Candidatus Prometheoarchaeum syntrophicum]